MKSRRRLSMILLMAASVFLFILASCGIPTYIVPTVNAQNTGSSSKSTTFNVSYKGDGVGDYGKVGLLLVYFLDSSESGTIDTSDKTKIINTFASKYKVSTNDGVVISVDSDSKLYDFTTYKSENGSVYAFELDGNQIEAPTYTVPMSTGGDFSSIITLDYIAENTIQMTVDGTVQETYLTIDKADKSIHVFAAISVQSSQYSNLFWSSLFYVGCLNTT